MTSASTKTGAQTGGAHAALMDAIYRRQARIYDVTRKYYLFGRDRMIGELKAPPGARVLELGCGTGRNLAQIARAWPGARLHGLDISPAMLTVARDRLGGRARLAQGDATDFAPQALFGCDTFDRVVFSFVLSMIPDWPGALAQAIRVLAPGGAIHIVDFHDCQGLPGPLARLLRAWLAHFHVTPRLTLADEARAQAAQAGLALRVITGPLGYYRLITLTRAG
ncbi:MAG: class I SAM-dependent methyltransferase [Novosphingobium aromaticivorans]|nr:class I SAM-dependent methyltransferase [Novosphingobium aromaticivorans]